MNWDMPGLMPGSGAQDLSHDMGIPAARIYIPDGPEDSWREFWVYKPAPGKRKLGLK